MATVAKISVEKFDSKEQILFEFDKSQSLEYNVRSICKKIGLPESKVYGVKFKPTKTNDKDFYVTEGNMHEIKHNDCLKAVFSMRFIIERIFNNISVDNADLRSIVFDDIHRLSLDPMFIDEIAKLEYDKVLIKAFTDQVLTSSEQLGLLKTVVHLFSKEYIRDTEQDLIQKAINILKNSDASTDEIRFTLSLLQKVLLSPNQNFDKWKEKIIREVPLKDINPYIWRSQAPDLQYSALLLINTIIKICKGDKRVQLIKEMNLRRTRENIYNFIILENRMDKAMEHELYVLQTYLLSLFTEALNSKICLDDNNLFKREEFELCQDDMKRITLLMDFDEANVQNHASFISVENLAFQEDSRISFASVRSQDTLRSSQRSSTRLGLENESAISHLTLEALRHYKNLHPKNFYQSQIEEKLYEPGIFSTSEKVVKMLAKLLHIGWESPDSKSTFYQPVVFYCSSKTPFFLELFSRAMWLLSRTRREMKVSTYTDYEKVMYILQKQVKTALKNKPKNFKDLTVEISNTSFRTVMDKIQKDKEEEMKNLINSHPCIKELKEKFTKENEAIIFRQRINVLLQGGHFPKVQEKKLHGNIFVKLTKNQSELHVHDIVDVKHTQKGSVTMEKFNIEDITHVVIGKNCQHAHLCPSPAVAFSIIVDHKEKVKFIAKDERTARYWTDALLLLTYRGTEGKLSSYYYQELEELVVMDIRLQLLELQNVVIPKEPPPIPPPPSVTKPALPPRPRSRRINNRL